MTCSDSAQAIHALVDGTLDEAGRHQLETHLATCAACRTLAADLREIRRAARTLDPLTPPPAVRARVAAQIRAQAASPSATAGLRRWSVGARWLAAAATLVLVIGAALLLLRPPSPQPSSSVPGADTVAEAQGSTTPDDLAQRVEAELTAAQQHYEAALASLERMAERGDPGADAHVAQTLRQNVALVDAAIADSRRALRVDPQSEPARESLFEALRRKVVLLQDTIALVNEMRKGNQAGAAAIAEGIKKS